MEYQNIRTGVYCGGNVPRSSRCNNIFEVKSQEYIFLFLTFFDLGFGSVRLVGVLRRVQPDRARGSLRRGSADPHHPAGQG